MKDPSHEEERVTCDLLDRLNRDGEAALVEAELILEYAEILALLPYDLEPVQPRDELWERIEARAAADASEEHEPTLVPFPRRPDSSAAPVSDAPVPAPVSVRSTAFRGAFAMAAALALCLLGLGYLLAQTRFQLSTIDELKSAQARGLEVSHYYDMVRRTARQYYPLRPVALSPREEPFYGRVWVCGMHQQWLLNIEGLKPAPAGQEYRFWFETEAGKVDGGVVEVLDGEAQLAASTMPRGTNGFSVTLEVEGSHPRKPQGEVLLETQEARDIVLGIEDLGGDAEHLSM